MHKVLLPLPILLLHLGSLSAQKESNIKLKIETGLLWDWHEGQIYLSGPFINFEPKFKVSKKAVMGLRIGVAQNTQAVKNSDPFQFYIEKNLGSNNATISIVPAFDYYFTKKRCAV